MSKTVTIEMPDDLAAFTQAKVSDGAYASIEEAVLAAVNTAKDRDAYLQRWMEEAVIPSFDAWDAAGRPTFSEEEVSAEIEKVFEDIERRSAK